MLCVRIRVGNGQHATPRLPWAFLKAMCVAAFWIVPSASATWCASKPTNGSFSLTGNCAFSSEVRLTGFESLEVVGQGLNLPIIQRLNNAVKHRYFRVDTNAKLVLRNMVLDGGDVSAALLPSLEDLECEFCGGAVFVNGLFSLFEAHNVEFLNNKAVNGGHVMARYGASIAFFGCKLDECTDGTNPIMEADDDGRCATYGSAIGCRGSSACTLRTTALKGAISCLCDGAGGIQNPRELALRTQNCISGDNTYPSCTIRL